ncbi:hypothetical protein [Niallia taxi]
MFLSDELNGLPKQEGNGDYKGLNGQEGVELQHIYYLEKSVRVES